MKRRNCWEYMQCGREPGGKNAAELGECPAATDTSYQGINNGTCGGRFCWAVAGTLCGGGVQGTFAEKRDSCTSCDFYKQVQHEEGKANMRTKFLRFVSAETGTSLLRGLTYRHIPGGERFITQDDRGETAYIIQTGACVELVAKQGELHPVGHRGEGDIVGVEALLTGERRHAHVEAETDMEVWVLNRTHLDLISRTNPDLHQFLFELVADRFDSQRPVADRTIGKYVATDIIGRGGYSIVYRGVHTDLDMPVAIKMLRHDMAMRPEFLDNFRNEAKIIAGLKHRNIVQVFDIEERYQTVFIVMECLKGESLAEMQHRLRRIPPKLTTHLLAQICRALAYAQDRGLIHGDINPSNVLVMPEDRLKLIDFGLACRVGSEGFNGGGSPPYVAPELLEGEPADQRSDIYALGATAYEMVTGRKSFEVQTPADCMAMVCQHDIPDPRELIPDLPTALATFITIAGRRDPAGRFHDARQALDSLEPLLDPILAPMGPSQSPPHTPQGRQFTLHLEGPPQSQQALNRLLDKLQSRMGELGGRLHIASSDSVAHPPDKGPPGNGTEPGKLRTK